MAAFASLRQHRFPMRRAQGPCAKFAVDAEGLVDAACAALLSGKVLPEDDSSRQTDVARGGGAFPAGLHFINWLGFAGWNALLHNYTIEQAGFGWFEAGLTQTVREIPGFLAFTVIFWLLLVREQAMAYAALIILGIGVALTGCQADADGILLTTFVMSVGFHYFETINTSLQLQLLPKAEARSLIGTHHQRRRARTVHRLRRPRNRLVGRLAATTQQIYVLFSAWRARC